MWRKRTVVTPFQLVTCESTAPAKLSGKNPLGTLTPPAAFSSMSLGSSRVVSRPNAGVEIAARLTSNLVAVGAYGDGANNATYSIATLRLLLRLPQMHQPFRYPPRADGGGGPRIALWKTTTKSAAEANPDTASPPIFSPLSVMLVTVDRLLSVASEVSSVGFEDTALRLEATRSSHHRPS